MTKLRGALTIRFVERRACANARPLLLLLFLIWNQEMVICIRNGTLTRHFISVTWKPDWKPLFFALSKIQLLQILVAWEERERGPTFVWCSAHDDQDVSPQQQRKSNRLLTKTIDHITSLETHKHHRKKQCNHNKTRYWSFGTVIGQYTALLIMFYIFTHQFSIE